MSIINYLLLIIILLLLGLLFLYKKDLEAVANELGYINNKSLKNRRIRPLTRNRSMNLLIGEINRNLREKQENERIHDRREEEMREMVASVSHDLRTPLTSIRGYTDLLLTRADQEDREYLEIIKSRTDSLGYLVSSFYELSKLELKELDMELDYVDLEESLSQVIASYYDRLMAKGLEPKIRIEPGDYKVLGDARAIDRIFINLIDNAIKYGGEELELGLYSQDDQIITEFINDSPGLDQASIDRIFNRFFVVDTSRQSESTGLGLYITKELVETMGYNIDASLDSGLIKIRITWKK